MKKILAVLSLVLLMNAGAGYGQTFQSLYSDHKARQAGDLITVLVVEFTEAENQAKTTTRSEDGTEVSASGSGALDFMPDVGFNGDISNRYSGSGSNSRTGSLKSKITVRIDSVLNGNTYMISGTRQLDVNNEKQIMELSGIVRSRDIRPDNTVYSYELADASITYKGKGIVNAGQKPGIIRRVLNWIF